MVSFMTEKNVPLKAMKENSIKYIAPVNEVNNRAPGFEIRFKESKWGKHFGSFNLVQSLITDKENIPDSLKGLKVKYICTIFDVIWYDIYDRLTGNNTSCILLTVLT